MTSFASLNLCPPVLHALAQEGYEAPTPIQAQSIPPILAGRDLLGCAQTGTGKTAAFALPLIQHLLGSTTEETKRGIRLPRALILAPTRELAGQIRDSFATYGKRTSLRHATIFGGVSQRGQEEALRRGVDVIVATPGRLIDLLQQRIVDLSRIKYFVLDEADRMLDMGFIDPIRRISAALPKDRQTLLFSATMPGKVMGLAQSLLKEPVRVSVESVAAENPRIDQVVYNVRRHDKQALLEHLIRTRRIQRAVVFTKTKRGAERVCNKLAAAGIRADALHGNKNQNQRQRALDGFRSGRTCVLVATDVAARGIDVDGITHVFNFDLPIEPESYVHRIGRTARAGATGSAIAFCATDERDMLRAIERVMKSPVRVAQLPAEFSPEAAFSQAPARPPATRPRAVSKPEGHADSSSGPRAGSMKSPLAAGKRNVKGWRTRPSYAR